MAERFYLSPQFENALHYAVIVHAYQERKDTGTPYVAHLLGVASLALEYGANEHEAIGALLHDAGEDGGGAGRIEDIRQRFGVAVGDIVLGCTDSLAEDPSKKAPWQERKEKYLAHLPHASPSVCLVSACDKLHNARAILRDYRAMGDTLWLRFTGRKEGTLWYYRSLVDVFKTTGAPSDLVEELDRVVSEIESLSRRD